MMMILWLYHCQPTSTQLDKWSPYHIYMCTCVLSVGWIGRCNKIGARPTKNRLHVTMWYAL